MAGEIEYVYDDANRLVSVDTQEYAWDDNGNLLSDGQYTYDYDEANRLSVVHGSPTTLFYSYNGLGDRVSRRVFNGVTNVITDYTNDIAAVLTQVLADNDYTYLYGNGRIAQYSATVTDYFLTDALGSVRQLVNQKGEVTLAESYEPFGETLESAGDGESAFAYAGEAVEAMTGYVYLRARFMDPYLNQWIQRDPIVPDPYIPADLNRYTYVRNNPINLTDPAGLSPECITGLDCVDLTPNHRDLTHWLFQELRTNASSSYTIQIHTFLTSYDPDKMGRGVLAWYNLVQDRAKWDFKHRIWGELEKKAFVLFHGINRNDFRWYEYSVAGNIHFGYVGRAAGFPEDVLHLGASWAEIRDPSHVDRGEACCVCPPNANSSICKTLGCFYLNMDWSSKTFDDPQDWAAVEAGMKMYDSYGRFLTYQGYQQFLRLYGPWLAHPTEYIEWGWVNQKGTWPYEVGHFNGPDENKYEPTIQELLFK